MDRQRSGQKVVELISFDFLELASFLEILSLSWIAQHNPVTRSHSFLFVPFYITSLQNVLLPNSANASMFFQFLDSAAKSNLTHP